jgi:hypothetical protein
MNEDLRRTDPDQFHTSFLQRLDRNIQIINRERHDMYPFTPRRNYACNWRVIMRWRNQFNERPILERKEGLPNVSISLVDCVTQTQPETISPVPNTFLDILNNNDYMIDFGDRHRSAC